MHNRHPPARRPAAVTGYALIALALGVLASILLFLFAYVTLTSSHVSRSTLVRDVQREIYYGGVRKIWQYLPECVAFDEILVYVPKIASCRFANPEFDTVLTFSEGGRRVREPVAARGRPILVLGDSQAMGWGVQDDETFAQVLADATQRSVYNLGVSSYGTARELIRALKSPAFEAADTLVIQYCDNDLDENREFRMRKHDDAEALFRSLLEQSDRSPWRTAAFVWDAWLDSTAVMLRAMTGRSAPPATQPFEPHYAPLLARLAAVPELRTKRVLIFYVNGHNPPFAGFPAGPDRTLPNVFFFDAKLTPGDFFAIDDHLTAAGHAKVGRVIAELVASATE